MVSIASFPHRLRRPALGVLLAVNQAPALAQQVYRLYPGAAPGSEKWTIAKKVRPAAGGGNIYSDVRDPTLTAYLPGPSADHGPVTEGLLALFPIWKAAGRSAELHVFQTPRLEARLSLDRFVKWLRERHIFQPSRSDNSAR